MKMRTHHTPSLALGTAVLAAAVLLSTAAVHGAANDQNTRRAIQADNRGVIHTQIVRASSHLGHDIISSDGRKVGDIVDFAFDLQDTPRLAYVLSMTGGFLDFGGDVRAIPAGAFRMNDDGTVRIDLDKSQYDSLAALPDNRRQHLETDAHHAEIDRVFGRDDFTRNDGRNEGRPALFRLYSELDGREVLSQEGARLGVIRDAWVSLEAGRAPYIEVDPQQTDEVFTVTDTGRHYVLPLGRLDPSRAGRSNAVTVALTEQEVESADSVTEQEGVRRVESDAAGNLVLSVALPATADRPNQATRNDANSGAISRTVTETRPVQIPQNVALAPEDVSHATLRHHAGQPVYADQGQKIGTVQDFVLEAGSGEIAGVIVATGGFMGLGERHHLVPVQSIQPDAGRSGFSVQVDETQFRTLPVLAAARDDQDGRIKLTDHERQAIAGVFGAEALPQARDGNDRHVRLSSLRGRTVRNHDGEIGEIEAIVVDTRNARAAALLDPSREVTAGDRKILVPLAQLEIDPRNGQALTTQVSLDEFRRISDGRQT